MILCSPYIETVIDFSKQNVPTLVIENPSFLRSVLQDLYNQADGTDGTLVLSENNKILDMEKWVEIIDNCLHFDLNRKPLLNKIISSIEKNAMSESNLLKTNEMLQVLLSYLNELTFDLNCDIVYNNCTVGGILKGIGVSIRDEYNNPLEKLIDYMELVREFERDKVFVFVNLRSFFSDSEVECFLKTTIDHAFHVLLIDAISAKKFPMEARITIDKDLCEL